MPCVMVQQIGEYGVLHDRDAFYPSAYVAEAKRVFRRSLHTNDPATAIAAVQSLVDRHGGGCVGGMR
ncbi:hypothetical protein ACVWWK_002669 [Bradyrhizobium sp. LB9.1b]